MNRTSGGYGSKVLARSTEEDIYSGEGVTKTISTNSNLNGIEKTIDILKDDFNGLVFTNLVDFDSLYGHRRDPEGYAQALKEFDSYLSQIIEKIGPEDLLIITADHGNDPTRPGTDHTREYVPVLLYNPTLKEMGSIGVRDTFSDLATTLADNFNVKSTENGHSFLNFLK